MRTLEWDTQVHSKSFSSSRIPRVREVLNSSPLLVLDVSQQKPHLEVVGFSQRAFLWKILAASTSVETLKQPWQPEGLIFCQPLSAPLRQQQQQQRRSAGSITPKENASKLSRDIIQLSHSHWILLKKLQLIMSWISVALQSFIWTLFWVKLHFWDQIVWIKYSLKSQSLIFDQRVPQCFFKLWLCHF